MPGDDFLPEHVSQTEQERNATRAMHTVVSDLCTGCNLCVDPCPTQCIDLRPVAPTTQNWKWDLHTIPVRTIPVEHHA